MFKGSIDHSKLIENLNELDRAAESLEKRMQEKIEIYKNDQKEVEKMKKIIKQRRV